MKRSQPRSQHFPGDWDFPGDWELSRQNMALLVLLVDQSASGASAAITERANGILADVCMRLCHAEGFKDYVDISVIGYHTCSKGLPIVRPILGGALAASELISLNDVGLNPQKIEVEHVVSKLDDSDEPIAIQVLRPVWIDSVESGAAPLGAALLRATLIVDAWLSRSSSSIPPLVLNLSCGRFAGPSPAQFASRLKSRATNLGNVLLCHELQIRDVSWTHHVLDTAACITELYESASLVPSSLRKVLFLWRGIKVENRSRLLFLNSERSFVGDYFSALDTGDRPAWSLSDDEKRYLESIEEDA
jgi:hypothetical protein